MSDVAQMNLAEPARTDWDNYNTGSKYQAPPPARDEKGQFIVYSGIVESLKEDYEGEYVDKDANGNPYLRFTIDSIKLVNAGPYDGYQIRFTTASLKPFEKNGEPQKGNPSKLGNLLRSAGMTAKPQTNAEWRAAVNQVKGKRIQFTVDWQAKDRDTGEVVKGFLSFPEDPERPGQRKSILNAGDTITERDPKGNVTGVKKVQSEVLFANARLRFFQDATPRVK